ncbi:hypothetical protein BLSMQ_3415 [Brevibacterium aurantiacum]|uniref:Uncharacterized protein n=1 Tax=Brevibacterium aurantiacum TaxID=273384 RepID=A0A1D7W828_BREAU|nr:hypothetical protein BLSMQ_3415 [Brevibacterium aurantiacum]
MPSFRSSSHIAEVGLTVEVTLILQWWVSRTRFTMDTLSTFPWLDLHCVNTMISRTHKGVT